MKSAAHALEYEDESMFKELLGNTTVKKAKKSQKKVNRDERLVGQMSVSGLIWYALFWKIFVPNNGLIAWTLFCASNMLWIVKVVR